MIAGLGYDLTSWPEPLVDGFAARGFLVVRHDNRDAGCSDRIAAPPPGRLRQLLSRPRPDAYTLADMAGDAVAVLDALGIARAHLVGMSLGGMIAQTVAARHPDRTATLTSIFSTTGARGTGGPALSTVARMVRPPSRTAEQAAERHLAMLDHIGGPGHPYDPARERAWTAGLWARTGGTHTGAPVARQIDAIRASGDRTAELRRITAPTLVVHGDTDRMVHPGGGRATAAAIPGARYVEIPGMGHHLAPGLLDRLVDLATGLAHTAPASGG
nr:alpha/beta fold hydrolase [Kitasatospora sp. SID7827]